MGFFKKIAGALSKKKYRKNPNAAVLTVEQYAALNVGAINAEQTMYFCDSLHTGSDKNEMRRNLADYYGIVDRDTALSTLDWLSSRGHRVYFEAIKQFISGLSTAIDETDLEEEQKVSTYEYIQNLNTSIEDLIKNKHIKKKVDLSTQSVVGWDMGRLVLVTRCCYELAYISEEEAWNYIRKAHRECQNTYLDWKEFADGYIIGRCMWGGSDMMRHGGIMGIAKGLLEDDESPWLKYPLRQNT
ncbi:DUF1266 domain-containing protein [Paenibacillus sp. HWE-109]|uniref:DUF1266 domain-containing protein n=1 Tax=Paenibacillus sp. HWE-109 TaxID=1306526 RepID=UPI001EE019D8|nr:DUF1266 domain-containing protein [Paenibacillus sp. HWE-109]UKS27874.1 DUF1266 domain-containing protein [Paenibacillus sp. HWE-109]